MPNFTVPRNVIYYNDTKYPLSDLANTAYTDVIVGFVEPSKNPDGSWVMRDDGKSIVVQFPTDGILGNDISKLRNAGMNVLLSVGGQFPGAWVSQNASPKNAYVQYSQSVYDLAVQIAFLVVSYGYSGVDIDYEDNSGFDGTGGYDGVQFLVDLSSQLFQLLPPGQNIITHAPQTPYWDASQWTNGAYAQIWQKNAGSIAWFNNQFYNQGAAYNDIEAYYPQIVNLGIPADRLMVGTLLSGTAAEGYIGLDAMMQVVSNLQAKYANFAGAFGGAMGWEFSDDTPNGAWGSQIAQALGLTAGGGKDGQPNPVPTSGNWSVNDLTAATNAPAAAGDPNGFTFTANGTSGMHVVYRGADNDIHELYWLNGDWNVNDLTAATNAPAAAGDPNGYMFTANGVSGMHVVYPSANGHINKFWWALS
jgi:chitinase